MIYYDRNCYFDNGLKIVFEKIPYVRSAAFGIWIKTGTRYEKPEENGVSHFIEHMMFKGTKKRSARQIAEEMDAMGGQINAYTTRSTHATIQGCWTEILTPFLMF